MYLINFAANFEECGTPEVNEAISTFNFKNEILLNQKVKMSDHEYDYPYLGFYCKTEDRLLEHLVAEILKRFEIREMTIEQIKN